MGTLISVIILASYWYIVLAVIAFILLVIIVKQCKKRSARKRALEAQRLKQLEAQKRIEQEKRERAEREKEAHRFAEEKERKIRAAMDAVQGSETHRLQEMQFEVNAKTLDLTDFTSIAKKRFVAFDLETTGLSYSDDAIVEIGAVRVENGQIVDTFTRLINPECPMPAAASAVNHITDDMLVGKPFIYEVLPAFLSFVGDDVLVAHNAPFDCRFLSQACMQNRFRAPTRYFDTMELKPVFFKDAPNKKLTTLTKAAGIEHDEAHRALGDAKALAELVIKTLCRPSTERNHEKVEVISNELSGLRFVLTGDAPGHDRAEIERMILRCGGKVTGTISSLTDYLVVGEYVSSGYVSDKQKKALELMKDGGKIKIISFPALFGMMNCRPN